MVWGITKPPIPILPTDHYTRSNRWRTRTIHDIYLISASEQTRTAYSLLLQLLPVLSRLSGLCHHG